MLGISKKYIDAMHVQSNWPILIFVWLLFGGSHIEGVWWWIVTMLLVLWPIKEEVSQKGVLTVFVAVILFYEELILSPLRKFVFPGVGWVIRVAPPWAIIAIFIVLEIAKFLAKPLMFVAFASGLMWTGIFLVAYVIVSFLNLQIMIHGSDKLREYWWFNVIYEWVVRTCGPYKKKVKTWFGNLGIVRYWNELKERAEEEGDSLIGQIWRDARERANKYQKKSQGEENP